MRTLNLGILAHVDAGKTSLTERLLYAAGVIDEIGSVDDGNTQTDSLALERQRGITIKSAVVSFVIDDVTVNLIDTPGHPDFIAEVERVLSVLDGAVLVISAVEGVQSQTRVLMRTLQRLRIPTLIFVNKIDRGGAHDERVLQDIAEKLTPAIIAMGSAHDLGTRSAAFTPYGAGDLAFRGRLADLLADHDDAILAAYVDDETAVSYRRLRGELAAQTSRALVHPVFFGSAITGAGVDALTAGIAELLPAAEGDADGPLSGTVFKVERGPAGEKIAYVRMFSGSVRTRDRLHFRPEAEEKVTAISVFDRGATRSACVGRRRTDREALGSRRCPDRRRDRHIATAPGRPLLRPADAGNGHRSAPPRRQGRAARRARSARRAGPADQPPAGRQSAGDVRLALRRGAEGGHPGDARERVRPRRRLPRDDDDLHRAADRHRCGRRAARQGEAIRSSQPSDCASSRLRSTPACSSGWRSSSGRCRSMSTRRRGLPGCGRGRGAEALRQGLYGWQVTDCTVTMTHSGYASPVSTAGDFRKLTPLVLMSALKQAGTVVCEPIHRFHLEIPADTLGSTVRALARLHAAPQATAMRGSSCTLEGEIPAARVHELQRRLRALTRGEGVLECAFDRYQPVRGPIPTRARTDHNPLNRKEYLLHVTRRV